MTPTRFRFPSIVMVALLAALSTSAQSALPPEAKKAAEAINVSTLRSSVRFLSSDLLEGRGPASRGDALARAYIATEMEQMGLEPGGSNGSWQQIVDLVGVTADVPKVWSFKANGKEIPLAFWDEYIASSGVQSPVVDVRDAELVFAGYGIEAPEYGWDDFKGTDVKGKILVMLNDDPDWDPALFGGKTRLYYGRWTYKYESAARHGAAGAIIIHTTPSAGYPFQVVQTSNTGEQFNLPSSGEPQLPIQGWATEDATRKLVKAAGLDLDALVASARSRAFKPVRLGLTTSIRFENKINRVTTANVIGLLRGSDPKLAAEVVVFSAHHDHLGIGVPNAAGDRIYNGARDNASGVAQVLAIARAFKALPTPPRRSIMFFFAAAEEQGLLGSAYYAAHPTYPPGKIAAIINFDSANIWGRTSDVRLIGAGKSSMDAVAEKYAAMQDRTARPDDAPEQGAFYRSDQFNFARIGVPALYMKGGTNYLNRPPSWGKEVTSAYNQKNYHQPTDELTDDWSYDGAIEDSALAFFVGLDVAQSDTLPTWVNGDEFAAARKKALGQ